MNEDQLSDPSPQEGEMIRVALLAHLVPDFIIWLAERNGRLFRIPGDDDLPTYGVTPINWGPR